MDQTTSLEPKENPQKLERPFEPFCGARSEALRTVVEEVISQVQNFENFHGLRKRARKATDQAIFKQTIEAIVCDLIRRHDELVDGLVFQSISHRVLAVKSRYRSSVLGSKFPDILKCLALPELAFIELKIGKVEEFVTEDGEVIRRAMATTFKAGPRLLSRIEENGLNASDTQINKVAETIVLKAPKEDHNDTGRYIQYQDDQTSEKYRKEMVVINDWIADADLELFVNGTDWGVTGNRHLRRIFNNGSFNQGGRIYGGFWQNASKENRRRSLRINGEETTELDYGQMSLRMLYGKANALLPDGDLYDVPGLNSREGVKKIINAALSSNKELSRMPVGTREFFLELEHHRYGKIIDTISAHHHAIAHYFYTGIGVELQFMESEIMIDVLLRSKHQDILVLPIHDGLMTQSSKAMEVKDIMMKVFKEHTGVDAKITEET